MQSKIRRQCFERDKYRCRSCNNSNGLHPHHIVYRSAGGKDELSNLVTVCWVCHRAIHDGFMNCWIEDTPNVSTFGQVIFARLKGWKP